MTLEQLKYPIGKFQKPGIITQAILNDYISEIELLPSRLRAEVENLNGEQLNTQYREGGWTFRQVVHHLADSHINSFIRFKLALTEDKPIIKPYFEERWAELVDAKLMSIEPSLNIIEGMHQRWVVLLRSFSNKDWEKCFIHPEHGKEVRLDVNTGIYAWHGNHHLGHITTLKKTKNWK